MFLADPIVPDWLLENESVTPIQTAFQEHGTSLDRGEIRALVCLAANRAAISLLSTDYYWSELNAEGRAMTGYTVHTGTTIRFSEGWDRIFQGDQDSTGKPAKSTKKGAKMKGSAAAKSRQTKASKIRRAKGQ